MQRFIVGATLRLPAIALCLLIAAPTARGQCTGCAHPSFGPAAGWFSGGGDANGFAVADFDQDGNLDVVLPVGTGATIHFGDGRGGFPTSAFVAVGSNYNFFTASGDFNGDGFPDLVLSNYGTFQVFLSDGQGGFLAAASGSTERGKILAADFDGDGLDDLVTAEGFFASRGDGTFAPRIAHPGGPYAWIFAMADYDGDGHPDFAASTGPTVSLLLARPGSAFVSAGSFTSASAALRSGAAAHVDAGTTMDLVVFDSHDFSPPSYVRTLLGDGAGGLVPGPFFVVDASVFSSLIAADFDGDGFADVVIGGTTDFYKGLGGGLFAPKVTYPGAAWSFEASDINRDGLPDLVAASTAFGVLLGNSAGGLQAPPVLVGVETPGGAAIGDVTGDGIPDLVAASAAGVDVFPGLGAAKLGAPVVYPLTSPASSIVLGDFKEDGHTDMVVGSGSQVVMFTADGSGGFLTPVPFETAIGVSAVAAGFLNADGHRDVVAAGGGVVLFFGDGLGSLSGPTPLSDVEAELVQIADVDGDGQADIVALGPTGINVFLGHGNGTFDAPVLTGPGGFPDSMAIADFNGDGKLDVVTNGDFQVPVYLGNGDGSFAAPITVDVTGQPGNLVAGAGDFNGDGKPDLAVAAQEEEVLYVFPGDGTGGFGPATRWLTPLYPRRMAIGDLDGDGKPDVATVGNQVGALRNSNCEPRRLGVGPDPATCAGPGEAFSQQPLLTVYDDGGNVIVCDSGVVTAALVPGTGTSGATLGGTTAVAASGGVAAFSNLSIDLAGSRYVLRFTHPTAASTGSRPVTVGGPPSPPVASNSGPFCQGQDLELFATTVPGAVYRWTGPNGFFASAQSPTLRGATLAAAGAYSVTALVAGCSSSAAQTVVAALPPQPGPTILGQHQVCGGTPLLLRTDVAANPYQWYLNGEAIPGATGPSYRVPVASGADAGYYTVTSSDASGCTTNPGPAYSVGLVSCAFLPVGLGVDSPGDGGNGNGILEPGESVVVHPSWIKTAGSSGALTGTATAFVGPSGGSYTIDDPSANYGTIPPATIADCATATGDCYGVTVSAPNGARPSAHWDTFLDETPASGSAVRTWVLHVGESFSDVPASHPFYASIERVLHNRITAGCTLSAYCPSDGITRAQMAVLLLKARQGPDFVPPPATGAVFADVPADAFAAAWIEELAREGITAGCGGGFYCPTRIVTRAQMAVFLLRTAYGSGFGPPSCTGIFSDVACPGAFAVDWIEFLYGQGITGGCNANPLLYCPDNSNTRGQMAVFIDRMFHLTLYVP